MNRTIKTEAQIFVTLFVATVVLVLISLTIGVGPQTGAAVDERAGPVQENLNEIGTQASGHFYFPVIHYKPTPKPEPFDYFTNFHDANADDWPDGTNGDCRYFFQNLTYKIRSNDKTSCLAPGPEEAQITYGEVEAVFQYSEGSKRFDAGVYMNGRGGGEYYLLTVDIAVDEGCKWEFTRRKDDKSRIELDGNCTKGFSLERTVKMTHASDGTLRFYIDGSEVGSFVDSAQLNRGEGVGLFVRGNESDDTTTKFLRFGVRRK